MNLRLLTNIGDGLRDYEQMLIGLFHLIFVTPCQGYMFLIVIPLRNSKLKTLYS